MRKWALMFVLLAGTAAAQGLDELRSPEGWLRALPDQGRYGLSREDFRWMADAAAEEGYTDPDNYIFTVSTERPTQTYTSARYGGRLSPGSHVLMAECPISPAGRGCTGGIDVEIVDLDTGTVLVRSRETDSSQVIPFDIEEKAGGGIFGGSTENYRVSVTGHGCDYPGQGSSDWTCFALVTIWDVPAGRAAPATRAGAERPDAAPPAAPEPSSEDPAVDPAIALTELVDSYLARVAEVASRQGYDRQVTVFRGRIGQGEEEIVTLTLPEAGEYAVLGVCDNDCSGLDLTLLDGANNELLDDGADDDVPVLALGMEESGTWPLRVRMRACGAEPCYWAVGVYRQ